MTQIVNILVIWRNKEHQSLNKKEIIPFTYQTGLTLTIISWKCPAFIIKNLFKKMYHRIYDIWLLSNVRNKKCENKKN